MSDRPGLHFGRAYLPLLRGLVRDELVLLESQRGTGKTRAILSIILLRALKWPGSRWGLFRSKRTRLTETVLNTLEEQVFPAFGIPVPGGAGRENRHSYPLPNGSVILPIGLDDPLRSTSLELAGGYIAEAIELTKMDDAVGLVGALRQAVAPAANGDELRHQMILDTNPGAPGHWLNQVAEPFPKAWRRIRTAADYRRLLEHGRRPPPAERWKRIVTCYADNPYSFDLERWQYTPAGAKYYNHTLGHLKGHLRRRWLDGEWAAAEGAVFPEFDEQRHVRPPFAIPASWPIYQLYDPGYDHPTGMSWVAYAPNGRRYVIDDMKESGVRRAEWAARVRKLEEDRGYRVVQRFADPHGAFSTRPDGTEAIAEQMRKDHGLVYARWPGNEQQKETMVEKHRTVLTTNLADGLPMLQVFDRCTHTINEHQSWRYKRNPRGEQLLGDDQFEDANNDILDGLVGASAMNLGPTRQALEVNTKGERPDKPPERPQVTIHRKRPGGRSRDVLSGLKFKVRA